jgi:hypothetical protein
MAIFVIIPQPNPNNNAPLPAAIAAAYPNKWHALDAGTGWLISATGTPQEISEKLGITSGKNGSGVVVEMASYFGRANPNTWTWIKTNWESSP